MGRSMQCGGKFSHFQVGINIRFFFLHISNKPVMKFFTFGFAHTVGLIFFFCRMWFRRLFFFLFFFGWDLVYFRDQWSRFPHIISHQNNDQNNRYSENHPSPPRNHRLHSHLINGHWLFIARNTYTECVCPGRKPIIRYFTLCCQQLPVTVRSLQFILI